MTKYLKYSDVIDAIGPTRAITLANMSIVKPADVRENVKGMWLPRNSGLVTWVRCSICGKRLFPDCKFNRTNYCPNCGANMRDSGVK